MQEIVIIVFDKCIIDLSLPDFVNFLSFTDICGDVFNVFIYACMLMSSLH